ncbi:hypothetical protein [Lacticaseibacillus parakribbianus]|uniref:hypothetical protein n=1 Tax=Lacticaseibacillus parakribbianus TaxID=2970927 RepID=UPI0021CB40FC|nr:hypothetical protein [Lacticaseibacillus parakribbianus]
MTPNEEWVKRFGELTGRNPTIAEYQAGKASGFDLSKLPEIAPKAARSTLENADGKQLAPQDGGIRRNKTRWVVGIVLVFAVIIGISVGKVIHESRVAAQAEARKQSLSISASRKTSLSVSSSKAIERSESRASSASEQSLRDHSVTGEWMTVIPKNNYDETFKLLGSQAYEDAPDENIADYGLTASSVVKEGDQWYWLFELTGDGKYYTLHKDPVVEAWVVGDVADITMQLDLEDSKTGEPYSIVFQNQYKQGGGNNYDLNYQGITHRFLVHASNYGDVLDTTADLGAYGETFDDQARAYIDAHAKTERAAATAKSSSIAKQTSERKASDKAAGRVHDSFGDEGYIGQTIIDPYN